MASAHRPRLIIAASGLTAPTVISAAKRFKCAAITIVHGLDLTIRHPLYQKVFIPAIRQSQLVIANSSNTARLARDAGVAADKIEILHPGVTLPSEQTINSDFRERHGLEGRRLLLSVGRLVPRKGLAEFVDRALPEIVTRDPRVVLLIAGGEATDALKRNTSVLGRIRQAVEQHRLHEHVRLLGRITDDAMLGTLYRESDVFVMPLVTCADDVEGFGMVAVEAAAHGLPTSGFKLGGLPDAVENGRSGLLVSPNDYSALIDAIFELLNKTGSAHITSTTCRAHAERFSWWRYGDQIRNICARIAPFHAAHNS